MLPRQNSSRPPPAKKVSFRYVDFHPIDDASIENYETLVCARVMSSVLCSSAPSKETSQGKGVIVVRGSSSPLDDLITPDGSVLPNEKVGHCDGVKTIPDNQANVERTRFVDTVNVPVI